MPALASHRKPRTRTTLRNHAPAVGVTTAAIASVTLLSSQSAAAMSVTPAEAGDIEGGPTADEVRKKVEDLYRQAGTGGTRPYDAAGPAPDRQRRAAGALTGAPTTALRLTGVPRSFTGRAPAPVLAPAPVAPAQPPAPVPAQDPVLAQAPTPGQAPAPVAPAQPPAPVPALRAVPAPASARPDAAVADTEALTTSPASLRVTKRTAQHKLAEARALLSRLAAEELARPARPERGPAGGARHRDATRAAGRAPRHQEPEHPGEDRSRPAGAATPDKPAGVAKADKVIAFARAQIGKPYVSGATGPSSYDSAGLTQAAWKAAGVDLPRTAWEQARVGTRVDTEDLRPGDLVFFYDDIRHVGIYLGDGMMIHAPAPGANVREESIYYMPVHGSVRPA
ncbi:NlpC/P60 family protein [Streptomyces sp. HMX112]|uniref:NlpC/P60 family protein n=1 Tax=Streptomyces sp. HMX112 TaxID=3390850 RepID=UPI003A7FA142